jgi:nicotinate-nucleotide--dimethylbenzimidazole phosphoribosyltransferase
LNCIVTKAHSLAMPTLEDTIASIRKPDPKFAGAAARRQATLTKPAGSLGRLEAIAEQACAATRSLSPGNARRAIVVFAADHGVVVENVSAYPATVTAQMVANFASGGAAINALARTAGARLVVVDVGVATPCSGVVARRVRAGTGNLAREPAMTRAEALHAVEIGIDVARELDADLLGVGEMGIGNSTAAAALASVLTDAPPAAVTGRGTGIDDARLAHKRAIVEGALALHRPRADDPLGTLAAVGGLEIAAIAGACLGAAAAGRLVIIDGFISAAGAAIAVALAPAAAAYLVAAHCSSEPGHAILLAHLGLVPILDLEMRLGEASGAALAMPIVAGAIAAFREMASFETAGVDGQC